MYVFEFDIGYFNVQCSQHVAEDIVVIKDEIHNYSLSFAQRHGNYLFFFTLRDTSWVRSPSTLIFL
jgi:hypothetical protein